MPVRNQVQLLTYPDSLGGSLAALHGLLNQDLKGLFGGVHILPPFPSSADRGFAPTTYFEIDPAFGTWEDIRRIGQQQDVMLDLMVNHISRQSVYFQDFARRGRQSPYADLFITLDKFWPGGEPDPADVAKIFLRRPEHPFADIAIAETGEVERVWATFGTRDWSEQIDLDVNAPVARRFFRDILKHFSRQYVNLVRLDAVAFVTKQPGTSCFFVEPQIYEFLEWMRAEAGAVGIELLLEIHAHDSVRHKLASRGYWVYDFALPLVVLHTLLNQTSQVLAAHLRSSPRTQYTQLDSHDGIPVQPDVEGILDLDAAEAVVNACVARGANVSRIFSAQHLTRPGFDAHQINCTYYSALGEDDDAYLAARAIQFFVPGIPQVYYVGLLAGENDPDELARVGDLRAINRHNYGQEEIEQALAKPVVQRLVRLIQLRNTHPAFGGEFSVLPGEDDEVRLGWEKDAARCELEVDLRTYRSRVKSTLAGGEEQEFTI